MGPRRAKVLIVEDDDKVALGLYGHLYRASKDFDLLLAPSAEIGRDIMRELAIDVLITDIYLPRMSGLDLAYWAAVESPQTQLVLITGQDVSSLRDQARALGCLRLLRKPFEARELLDVVLEALDCRGQLSGRLSALSAADLIQMLCLGQKTTALRITAAGVTGSVMVQQGRLIHATWGEKTGVEAIYEVLAAEDGVFNMLPLPPGTPITITSDWQHVLLEAARWLDERSEDRYEEPLSRRLVRPDDALLSEAAAQEDWPLGGDEPGSWGGLDLSNLDDAGRRLDRTVAAARLVDRGFVALRTGKFENARRYWQAAQRLDPENRSIELNLRKLESLASRERAPNGSPAPPPGTSQSAPPGSPEDSASTLLPGTLRDRTAEGQKS